MKGFFTSLQELMQDNSSTTVVARRNADGTMTVSVNYKADVEDPAASLIQPVCLTGTPCELDEGFIREIAEPLEKSIGLQASMSDFEASLKVAQASSKAAAEQKRQKEDAEKKRKDNLKNLTESAEKAINDKNWSEAIKAFTKSIEFASEAEKTRIQAKINECREQENTIPMFEDYDMEDDLPEDLPEDPRYSSDNAAQAIW